MNKPFLYYLFWLAVLFACHGTGSHHTTKTDTLSLTEVTTKADRPVEDLDSSMVSLKTFGSLSLEDAISQRWDFDDADKAHWDKVFWDSVTNTRQYPELALFPDHSALMDPRCRVKTGTWNLDKENGEMSLLWKDGSADLFIVRQRVLRHDACNQQYAQQASRESPWQPQRPRSGHQAPNDKDQRRDGYPRRHPVDIEQYTGGERAYCPGETAT